MNINSHIRRLEKPNPSFHVILLHCNSRFTSPARPLLHCAREYHCCRCQNHCTRCVRSGDPSVSASGSYETEHHTLTECRDVTCTPCCRLPHNNCSTQEEDCYVHPETNIIVPYTADFSFANDSIYFSDDSVSSCNGPLDLSISSIGTSVRWCNESACSDGYRGCSEFEGDMSNDNSRVSEADMASDSCPLSEEVSITNTENEQPTRIEDVPASEIVSMLKIVSTRDSETQTEEHMTLLAHCSSDKVVFKSTVRKRRQKKNKRLKRDVFNDDARVDSMVLDVKQFITSPMEYVKQLLILGALNLVSLFFR